MLRACENQHSPQLTVTNSTDQSSCDESGAQLTVFVWDQGGAHLQTINRVLAECGARAHWAEDLSAAQEIKCSSYGKLALINLGSSPSIGDRHFEDARELHQRGFKVICYGEHAQGWPLDIRCQILLTGSLWLLDSARREFAEELRRLLTQLIAAEAEKQSEEEKIKGLMVQTGIAGTSQAIISVFRLIVRLSMVSDLPTLITGETGTGKELLAHAIYQLDPKRCHGPFVVLNCGAISPGLAESELFGHRRGAFTGADRDRKGLIRTAQGGILFLDEIGELDSALQTKLLRVLQENRVLGVGEDQEVSVSVRIIAATNRNLKEMVEQGKFRADLFHRLNAMSVHIPPLRERPEDLKPLIEHFLKKYQSPESARAHTVGADFVEALAQVEMPGNARQLENLVWRTLVNKDNDAPISLSDLPPEIWYELSEKGKSSLDQTGRAASDQSMNMPEEPGAALNAAARPDLHSHLSELLNLQGWNLSQSLAHCERLLVESALYLARGNQSQTAKLLGITPRSVYNKVRKFQLH